MRRFGVGVLAALIITSWSSAEAQACGVTPRDAAVRYYHGIDRGHFSAAWRCLSTATRQAFGGYEAWKAGYASTRWTRLRSAVTTAQAGGLADVRVRVRSCRQRRSAVVERFRGTWQALNGYAGWRLHEPRLDRVGHQRRRHC